VDNVCLLILYDILIFKHRFICCQNFADIAQYSFLYKGACVPVGALLLKKTKHPKQDPRTDIL